MRSKLREGGKLVDLAVGVLMINNIYVCVQVMDKNGHSLIGWLIILGFGWAAMRVLRSGLSEDKSSSHPEEG